MFTARSIRRCLGPALALSALATPLAAQESAAEWAERCRRGRDDHRRGVHCEVRELSLAATGRLQADAKPNGGVTVRGWDQNRVRVVAKLQARADTDAEARDLARRVEVQGRDGVLRAEGPRSRGDTHWSISYEVWVPRRTDLELRSTNGGIGVTDVRGRMTLSTTNGGIRLDGVAGDVRGETSNGGLNVRLTGDRWEGERLSLETSNGGISLEIPERYSAQLRASTSNGGLSADGLPVEREGWTRRRIDAQLGRGGAPVELRTTNGGIRVRRR